MTGLTHESTRYGQAVLHLWKQSGQIKTITVDGQSMLPLLRRGDRVTVKCGVSPVRRGDLVVFYRQRQLVIHRVVLLSRSAAGLTLVTKGDNALTCDAPLQLDELVGLVSTLRRGRQTVFLEKPDWRYTNELIAALSLAAARLVGRGVRFKHRFYGLRANPATTAARLAVGRLLTLGLSLIHWIMWRIGR